jgi:hypothetical protein
MKKLIAPLFAASLFLFACKKDAAPNQVNNTASFSYKADGTAVTVDSAHATLYSLGVAPFNRMIDVYAFKGGLQVLEFHFKPTAGTYTADGTFNNAWLTYTTGINYPDDYYNSTSGSLNLTLCDTVSKKIEGTFNFTGNNGTSNKSITEGIMKVNITEVH